MFSKIIRGRRQREREREREKDRESERDRERERARVRERGTRTTHPTLPLKSRHCAGVAPTNSLELSQHVDFDPWLDNWL